MKEAVHHLIQSKRAAFEVLDDGTVRVYYYAPGNSEMQKLVFPLDDLSEISSLVASIVDYDRFGFDPTQPDHDHITEELQDADITRVISPSGAEGHRDPVTESIRSQEPEARVGPEPRSGSWLRYRGSSS